MKVLLLGGAFFAIALAMVCGCAGNGSSPATPSSSCSFVVSPLSPSVASGVGTIVIGVTTASSCSWTAASNDSWMIVTAGTAGIGNGTVTVSVAAQSTPLARTGTLAVAGKTITVTQSAPPCSYSVSPTAQTAPVGGGAFTMDITTTSLCTWSATSSASWITFSGAATGSGAGAVTASVAANTSNASRTGTVTIANQVTTVTQGFDSLAVAQISPADGVVFDNFPRTITLQWTSSPDAARYSVDVDVCQPPGCSVGVAFPLNPPFFNLSVTSVTFNFVGAQPGRWRVWAISAVGREGPKTAWREFRFSR